jgi:two-component system response regulator PrrA
VQRSPRVLVVDDDPDVLASLERGLRLSDSTWRRPSICAEVPQRHRDWPDAIVLDINMPVPTVSAW